MVIVRNAVILHMISWRFHRDVQIPGRIAAKAGGAMAEDTAGIVREVGFRVR